MRKQLADLLTGSTVPIRSMTERDEVKMDLLELRKQIDEIDRQIVSLYEQRMDISSQVADYKIETGKKVFDKERELEKLRTLKALTQNEFNAQGIQELFEQIMSMSRKLQYKKLTDRGILGRLPFIGVLIDDTGCGIFNRQYRIICAAFLYGAHGVPKSIHMKTIYIFSEKLQHRHLGVSALCPLKNDSALFSVKRIHTDKRQSAEDPSVSQLLILQFPAHRPSYTKIIFLL